MTGPLVALFILGLGGAIGWFGLSRPPLEARENSRAKRLWLAWGICGAAALLLLAVLSHPLTLAAAVGWLVAGCAIGATHLKGPSEEKEDLPSGLLPGEKIPTGSWMIEPMPRAVERALAKQGIDKRSVLAGVPADFAPDGSFRPHYVIVTSDRILSYALTDGKATIEHEALLSDLADISSESLVGGGRLEVQKGDKRYIVARFSNAYAKDFSGVARKVREYLRRRDDVTGEHKDKKKEARKLTFIDLGEPEQRKCPKCGRVLLENTKVCPNCIERSRTLRRLLGMSAPYWKGITALGLLMMLGTALSLAPPYMTKVIIDEILRPRLHFAWLGPIVLGLVSIRLIGMGITIVRGRLAVRIGGRVTMELRGKVFHHLQSLSLGYFDKQKVGTLMTRVGHDTQRVQNFLVDGIQFTVINILTVFGIGIIMLMLSWKLTLLVFIPAPLVVLMSTWFWPRIMSMFRGWWERNARLSAFLSDSLSGIRVIKAFGRESRERRKFDQRSEDVYNALVRAEQTWSTFFPLLSLVMGSGGLLIWYFGGRQVLRNEITLGTLVAFLSYLGMFFGPLQVITRMSNWLTRALTSAERVFEVLDARRQIDEAPDAVAMPRIEGEVEFREVNFGYDKLKPVLHDINLKVAPGEMIGFVGPSGAGKSTTINLVCRLYDADSGVILIDGVDIKKIKQADLRTQIGMVLQETYLFAGPVAENIAYARPGARKEELIQAALAANAHDFIMNMPDGYDSDVGERGKNLSGGEKQRVAIARAILHNPRILILDEATSSVDAQTEKKIQEALARLVKRRTTFAIAHRLSTLRNANRLLVLERGKVAEAGTHKELLKRKGTYAKLVEIQAESSRVMVVRG